MFDFSREGQENKKVIDCKIIMTSRGHTILALEQRVTHVENFFVSKLQYFLHFKYIRM